MTKNSDEKIEREKIRDLRAELVDRLNGVVHTHRVLPVTAYGLPDECQRLLEKNYDLEAVFIERSLTYVAFILPQRPLASMMRTATEGAYASGMDGWMYAVVGNYHATRRMADLYLPKKLAKHCEHKKRRVILVERATRFSLYEAVEPIFEIKKTELIVSTP